MIMTANGGRADSGTEFDDSVPESERASIIEREGRLAAWRASLPKRKPRVDQLPGPCSTINCSGLGWTWSGR
jgi:hypothetical protein